eukprot:jgi/Botrbrau1/16652/Bobra.0068s0068.1
MLCMRPAPKQRWPAATWMGAKLMETSSVYSMYWSPERPSSPYPRHLLRLCGALWTGLGTGMAGPGSHPGGSACPRPHLVATGFPRLPGGSACRHPHAGAPMGTREACPPLGEDFRHRQSAEGRPLPHLGEAGTTGEGPPPLCGADRLPRRGAAAAPPSGAGPDPLFAAAPVPLPIPRRRGSRRRHLAGLLLESGASPLRSPHHRALPPALPPVSRLTSSASAVSSCAQYIGIWGTTFLYPEVAQVSGGLSGRCYFGSQVGKTLLRLLVRGFEILPASSSLSLLVAVTGDK